MDDTTFNYNITAFKDANGTIRVSDNASSYVTEILKIRQDFIETVIFEQLNKEQLESILYYTLEEIFKRD